MDNQQHYQIGEAATTKIERKVLEKNRRNLMKDLCLKLNSLLPNFNPREPLRRGEQIDEAVKYIERLETRVKMGKEKKERLLLLIGRNNNNNNKRCRGTEEESLKMATRMKAPIRMEVHEMGSSLQVVLTCGFESHFIFTEIIRILHEHNFDVVAANSSLNADSTLHVLHAHQIRQFNQSGATKVSEKLKRFVNGHRQDFQGT